MGHLLEVHGPGDQGGWERAPREVTAALSQALITTEVAHVVLKKAAGHASIQVRGGSRWGSWGTATSLSFRHSQLSPAPRGLTGRMVVSERFARFVECHGELGPVFEKELRRVSDECGKKTEQTRRALMRRRA